MMTDIAYLGLGSNLSDPKAQIESALNCIHRHSQISLQACSHLYCSQPMGPQDQPEYLNAVCKITSSLSPIELLDALQEIESKHGRTRSGDRWGPRTLDLDILLYNNIDINEERLTIPHIGMAEREFVLVPLFEIAPDMIMQDGLPLAAWIAKCSLSGLKRLESDMTIDALVHSGS